MKILRYTVIALGLLFSGCYPKSHSKLNQESNALEEGARLTLDSREEYRNISYIRDELETVQFVHFYGVPKDNPLFDQVHLINFAKSSTHFDYVYKYFDRWKEALEGDWRLTADVQKEVNGGSLYYRPAKDGKGEVLAFHFAYEVNRSPENVREFYDKLRLALPYLSEDAFLFLGDSSSEVLEAEKLGIRGARLNDFFETTANYEFYSEGTSYGYLRRISPADLKAGRYNEKDILILDEIPLDLGPVSGVVSSVPQVPNSHVILRCLNQEVPDLYLKTIPKWFDRYEGQLVRLSVSKENMWTLEGVDSLPNISTEAEKYWKDRQEIIPTPTVDLNERDIYHWRGKAQDPRLVKSYGAKASNFAILDEELSLQGIDRRQYDQSFMVPYSFYADHLQGEIKAKSCEKAAKKCLKDEGQVCKEALSLCEGLVNSSINDYIMKVVEKQSEMAAKPELRSQYLSFTRRLIRAIDLPPHVLEAIRKGLAAYPENRRMRLRSSTNAEDLSGLSGAGLYDSKAACLGDPEGADDDDGQPSACRTPFEEVRIAEQVKKLREYQDPSGELAEAADELEESLTNKYSLSDSIRAVYASTWTERAYLNREYYGLIHQKVYMGILAHPSFIDEFANGVAVVNFTANGAELNIVSQVGDISITNPLFPDARPEQTLGKVDSAGKLLGFDIISKSSLSPLVIPNEEKRLDLARQLYIAAKAVKKHLGKDRFDLEFMLDADQNVIIKQARPL